MSRHLLVVVHNLIKNFLRKINQIHFVHAHHYLFDSQQRSHIRVTDSLLHNAVAGIDQNHRQIGRGCSGNHISGIFNMSRRVGNDEFTLWRGKIAVRHIDGDSLLTFGTESVGEQCKVNFFVSTTFRGSFNRFHLVFENRFAVVEQTPNQRAFTIVNTASRCKTEQLHIQISVVHFS